MSSTPLTKYLVGKIKNEFNTSNAGYGFLTMSQQHRLITLLDDYDNLENSKCLKQILFGIWINLRNEKIQKDEKGNCNLDELISKHKSLIYSRCLNYLFRTTKIETGYSPSPDEGVFLLVVFLNKTQVFLEVKLSPNEKEKHSSPYNDNRRFLFEGLSNNWLIIRKTIPLGKDIPDYLFDLSRDKSLKVSHVCDYIKTLSNRSQSSGRDSTARNKNFKDPLKELFEDDIEDSCALNAYNLPTPFKDDSKVKFASNQMQSHNGSGNPKLNNLYGKENSNRSHKDFSQSQSLSLTNYVNEGLGSQVSKQTTREEFRTIQPNHHKKVMSLHNATSLNTNVTHTFNNPSKRKTFQHHNNSGSSLSYSQTNSNWKNPCNFNEMKNAYEIICDQAKSIQELQEKVLLLTNQLNLVSSRLKSTGSFCPNCSGKEKIPSVVAVNSTDTSNENKSSRGKNNLSIQHQQNSNQLIRNYSSPCNDDMKFDNFLNENSINFPKQFLDIDSKQFESNLGIDNFNEGNNMSINVTNGDNKHHSVSGINFAERNYQLMKNANIFNDMFNDSLSHNLISNDLLSKASLKLNTQEEQNVKPLNVISPINANINATSIDVDVTTNSNDPSTQRYFLKVPSMIRRSNSSLYHAEDNISSRKKVISYIFI